MLSSSVALSCASFIASLRALNLLNRSSCISNIELCSSVIDSSSSTIPASMLCNSASGDSFDASSTSRPKSTSRKTSTTSVNDPPSKVDIFCVDGDTIRLSISDEDGIEGSFPPRDDFGRADRRADVGFDFGLWDWDFGWGFKTFWL